MFRSYFIISSWWIHINELPTYIEVTARESVKIQLKLTIFFPRLVVANVIGISIRRCGYNDHTCNFRFVGYHDDVIKWKYFPRYWPFVRGIHRLPVNSPHKGQWRRALMFSLICTRINGLVNNHGVGDLRRHWPHYDVTVMIVDVISVSSVIKPATWLTSTGSV